MTKPERVAREPVEIDLVKLRAAIHKLGHEYLFEHHYKHGRDKMLAVARKSATPEQRKALAKVAERQAGQRQGGSET